MEDAFGRRISYLRISVTDRCNMRCTYCMPDGIELKPREEILAYGEIERFVRIAVGEGIGHVRLTGGEPLVRRDIVSLVERLDAIDGIDGVTLTTNGSLLAGMARDLAAAGVRRVNVSLDSLDPDTYAEMTGGGDLRDVLAGLDAALEAGMEPVKVNVVVLPGFDQDVTRFAALTMDRPLHVRFIEYMPLGPEPRAGAYRTFVPAARILDALRAEGEASGWGSLTPLGPQQAPSGWGPARYFRFEHASGTIGLIAARSEHFCATCDRLRLTADGRLRVCLFSDTEVDVRGALRTGTDDDVRSLIRKAVALRPAGHGMRSGTERGMSQIGG